MPVFNQSRSRIIRFIFLGIFLLIIAQLVNLQLFSKKYRIEANQNAILKKIVYPSRGIIYDRKNRPILKNTTMFDLMVTPAEIKSIDTAVLCNILGIDTAIFRKRIVDAIIKNSRFRPSVFEPLLTQQLHARIEENIWRFNNGFFLQERPIREYPFDAAAHILGYIAEVSPGEIEQSDNFYRMGDYIGKNGLEAYYENILMGERGVQFLLRDNFNRVQGPYENGAFDTAAVAGRGLRTYLDIELQQLAEKLMANKVGAVVAIEPKTGGILAMVSAPNFNPNDLAGSLYSKKYGELALDVSNPLLNRAIKGQYEPGSTYKPIGALIALEEGVITPSFGYPCTGRYNACGHGKPACTHSGGGHAANLRLSIANSCNAYYAHVFRLTIDNPKYKNVKTGYQAWKKYMNIFGMGVKLGVDLPSEDNGNIPDSSVYNREYRNAWNSCTNLTLGIGQDKMQATPLQLANAMCIIANKGYYYTPHFVNKIDEESAGDTLMYKFRRKHDVMTHIRDTVFETVISGMQDVVEGGTARSAAIPGINVCAKTGTAEKYTILDGKRIQLKDNSVFVCFAPRENPRIAIAVIVENSGFGGTWAGPISSILMEKYLNDTLRPERIKKAEEIAAADLMPLHLKRLQYLTDSTRAYYWFNLTNDSAYIKKYITVTNKPFNKDRSPREKKNPIAFIVAVDNKKQERKGGMQERI
ncbi:MAG: penicillin-binding protein 2 [Bacteroidia bacterium]|nr:penicillin-binding protein 2 [Bacteroidia bacterium]